MYNNAVCTTILLYADAAVVITSYNTPKSSIYNSTYICVERRSFVREFHCTFSIPTTWWSINRWKRKNSRVNLIDIWSAMGRACASSRLRTSEVLESIFYFYFIGGRDVLEGWSSLLVVHFQFHHLGLLRLFVSSFFCCYCCELWALGQVKPQLMWYGQWQMYIIK